ncbi:SDR family NAD(P)-dependent oxidoreductase [Leifsonia aquatica]|uniref:SDR family NAD(P)-dependent oxidoreductase n=1 Tax=Leifsonia aquatica TaxID=144185 RepID=UPI000469DB2D|nr:SDR family NAD(P)-dependent oxidoreductase [Leifsonia aquatica]
MSAALVVGANGRIGEAICRRLGADGHTILPLARDAAALRRLVDALRAEGIDCAEPVAVDATDDAGLTAGIEGLAAEHPLAVCVNNVGRGHRPAPLADLDPDEFDAVVAVTFRSVAVAMRAELRALHRADGPRAIVNVASSAGTSAAPGMSAYVAAKHAVVGLTRTAALDEAAGDIRVNAVAPGPIASGPILTQSEETRAHVGSLMPLGRMGSAEEVASAVGWLASPAASYVTGVVLPVDGGKAA